MDTCFQEIIEKQQQLVGGVATTSNFPPFALNVIPIGVSVQKQNSITPDVTHEYFNETQWKRNDQPSHLTGEITLGPCNSNNTNGLVQLPIQQDSLSDYDITIASQSSIGHDYSTEHQHQHPVLLNRNSISMKTNPMSQVLLPSDTSSCTAMHQTQVLSQLQELDSQQEQVIASNDMEEENFNSQLVLAFLWIEAKLCAELKTLSFCDRVAYTYNPLEYASGPHAHYVSKYCGTKTILFLGMNPGPYGMAQNGVPFGDTRYVKEWLKISGEVHQPLNEHPRRPIQGLECNRSEVSGARFWGFIAKICGSPENFFRKCFVHNYCPLALMTKTGKNVIPPALPTFDRRCLEAVCDTALLQCIRVLRCQVVVAVGKYAAERATHVLQVSGDESSASIRVERILHPSPASPQANSGWEETVTRQLHDCGVLQYLQNPD